MMQFSYLHRVQMGEKIYCTPLMNSCNDHIHDGYTFQNNAYEITTYWREILPPSNTKLGSG
jgi:hypothetical protein